MRLRQERLDLRLEIFPVGRVDLGRDLELEPATRRDRDGAIDTFFGRDTPQEGQIAALDRQRSEQVMGKAVVDRLEPSGPRHRPPLDIRDRDHRRMGERLEHRMKLGKIETPVKRRDEGCVAAAEQREGQVVEVAVNDVELVGLPVNLLQHVEMRCDPVPDGAVAAHRTWP